MRLTVSAPGKVLSLFQQLRASQICEGRKVFAWQALRPAKTYFSTGFLLFGGGVFFGSPFLLLVNRYAAHDDFLHSVGGSALSGLPPAAISLILRSRSSFFLSA